MHDKIVIKSWNAMLTYLFSIWDLKSLHLVEHTKKNSGSQTNLNIGIVIIETLSKFDPAYSCVD